MSDDPGARATRRAFLRGAAALGLMEFGALRPRWVRANSLRVGQTAPPATLVTLDGQRISTADLIGQMVIPTFWATWCGPCRQELPLLSAYAAQHSSAGLSVLGFTLDDPEDLRKVQAAAQSMRFPVGFVANSTLPGYGMRTRMGGLYCCASKSAPGMARECPRRRSSTRWSTRMRLF